MEVVETCRDPSKEYLPLKVGEYFKKRISAARSKHPDGSTPQNRGEGGEKLVLETVKEVAIAA